MKKLNKIILLLFILLWKINVFSQFSDLPIQNQKGYKLLDEEIQKSFRNSKSFSYKDTSLRLFMVFNLHTIDTITKEEYTDGSFLKKLKYEYVYDNKNKNKSYDPPKDSIVYAGITVYSSKINSIADYPFDYMFIAGFSYGHMRFYNSKEISKIEKRKYIRGLLRGRKANLKSREELYNINRLRINSFYGSSPPNEIRKYMWYKGNFFIFRMPDVKINVFFIINEQLKIFVFFNEPDKDETYNILPLKEFIDKHWDCFSNENEIWFRNCYIKKTKK
jgi:hypothetical protein